MAIGTHQGLNRKYNAKMTSPLQPSPLLLKLVFTSATLRIICDTNMLDTLILVRTAWVTCLAILVPHKYFSNIIKWGEHIVFSIWVTHKLLSQNEAHTSGALKAKTPLGASSL